MLTARSLMIPTGIFLLLAIALPAPCRAQEPASGVRDLAGMFDYETVRKARAELERIERTYRVPILIETIDDLNGEPINDAARERDKRAGNKGVYILIARGNRQISNALVPRALADRLPEERRLAIREAFITHFKKADFDSGLLEGIAATEQALKDAAASLPAEKLPEGERRSEHSGAAADSPLVVRNQVRLALAGARRILAGAEAKAASMNLKVNIAVVDDGGHLVAFARMDGARPASGYTATTKAITAATFRAPTGPIPPGTTSPDLLLNLSLQNAAAASGGKLTTLYGGVPIVVDGQVIGGVGVGGGTGEQDAEIARAGIAKLTEELK
jgi:glc operon protein GlcG